MREPSRKPVMAVMALLLAAGLGWFGGNVMHGPSAEAGGAVNVPSPVGAVLSTSTIPTMVKAAGPAVVEITAVVQNNQGIPGLSGGSSEDLGSGFFISGNGEIVTNDHVVNGATDIMVQIPGHQGLYSAQVVGTDYNMDLALLKVNVPFTVPYLSFADSSKVQVGQFAVAIGNPDGLNQTVTLGIISAEGRPITIQNRQYVNLLQTDAAINPGNSGGPLLNLNGQVVGVNTAVQTNAQGVGFAIPASQVEEALPYLQRGTTVPQAWLGVSITTVNPQIAQQNGLPSLYGAVITNVVLGGPADKAGIRPGEVVTRFNSSTVTSASDLLNDVMASKPGASVALTVWDNGTTRTVDVTLGTKPQNLNFNR